MPKSISRERHSNKHRSWRLPHRLSCVFVLMLVLTGLPPTATRATQIKLPVSEAAALTRGNQEESPGFDLERRRIHINEHMSQSLKERQERRQRIESIWIDQLESGKMVWVAYGANLRQRVVVDFQEGWLSTQMIMDDAQAAISEKEVRVRLAEHLAQVLRWQEPTAAGDSQPFIRRQLQPVEESDIEVVPIRQFASRVVERQKIAWHEQQESEGGIQTRVEVRLPFRQDHLRHRREWYRALVERNATEFRVDPNLVMAMIEVESAFNPRAVSPARAIGLMQIVPDQGGRDAAAICSDLDWPLPPESYFNPEVNVRLGCAYIHQLQYNHFKGVRDARSRLYMTIAAYNGGSANVARALAGSPRLGAAVATANGMTAREVRDRLLRRLPAEESRSHLRKVLAAMRRYQA